MKKNDVDAPTVSRAELLLDDDGRTFRQFLNDFIWLTRKIEEGRVGFAKLMDLNPAQYSMIVLISQVPDNAGLSPGKVSEQLHYHQPYTTLHLGKLEKRGLLDRFVNEEDRRSVLYRLSTEGISLIRKITPLIQKTNDQFFEQVSKGEMKALAKTFRKLAKRADDVVLMTEMELRRSEFSVD